MHLDFCRVLIDVVEFVSREWLDALVVDAVHERDVCQVLVFRNREVPEILVVSAIPDLRARVVPEKTRARSHALVLPEEGIELSGQLALRNRKGEPAGFRPERIIGRRRVELVVGVHIHDARGLLRWDLHPIAVDPFGRTLDSARLAVGFSNESLGRLLCGLVVLTPEGDRDPHARALDQHAPFDASSEGALGIARCHAQHRDRVAIRRLERNLRSTIPGYRVDLNAFFQAPETLLTRSRCRDSRSDRLVRHGGRSGGVRRFVVQGSRPTFPVR